MRGTSHSSKSFLCTVENDSTLTCSEIPSSAPVAQRQPVRTNVPTNNYRQPVRTNIPTNLPQRNTNTRNTTRSNNINNNAQRNTTRANVDVNGTKANGTFFHPISGEELVYYGPSFESVKTPVASAQNCHAKEKERCALEDDYIGRVESNLTNAVNNKLIQYGFASGQTKGEVHSFVAGDAFPATGSSPAIPFTKDTFFRMASGGKFVGVTGLLKLIDRGVLTGFERLSEFFPAFANTKVMQAFNPTVYGSPIPISDLSLSFNNAGNLAEMTISYGGSAFSVGDWVSIEYGPVGVNGLLPAGAITLPTVNGVPGFTVYNIHQVTAVNPGVSITVILPSASAGTGSGFGAHIVLQKVDSATKRAARFVLGNFTPVQPHIQNLYYKLVDLQRPILIHHVLNHTYGMSYFNAALFYNSFGFSEDDNLRNTQGGILNELGVFAAVSLNLNPAVTNIQSWVNNIAKVPLLFQPGDKWSYGPGLSILGGVVEKVTGTPFEQYLKNEVLIPLGMTNSGFHISPSDTAKIANFPDEYWNFATSTNPGLAALGLKSLSFFSSAPFNFSLPDLVNKSFYNGTSISLIDGGMYSTVNDFLKFQYMVINGGVGANGARILSKAMLLNLSRNHIGQNTIKNIFDGVAGGQLNIKTPTVNLAKWGLGVCVTTGADTYARESSLNGASRRSIAWLGAFGTMWTIDLANGISTHVGSNTIGFAAGNTTTQLIPDQTSYELSRYQGKLINLYHAAFPCVCDNNTNITSESDFLN